MASCSVCDARFSDDLRECPVCGAPSTRVMDALDHEDEEWERLAGDYLPPRREREPGTGQASERTRDQGANERAADDERWAELAGRLGDLAAPGPAERARLRAGGLLRRLRRRG